MQTSQLAWELGRETGMVAYLLLLGSVILGLVVSLQWRSARWPRFISTEMHEFTTLLALLATGAHTLAIAVDPFMHFSLGEITIPLASHYRPAWMAWGIVGAYLMIAIWFSKQARSRVGYAWWRRFHYTTFFAYVMVTLHGLGMGSDTRTVWAGAVYIGGFLAVTGLLAARLLTPPSPQRRHPWAALAALSIALGGVSWATSGPLKPGWSAIANRSQGSNGRVAVVSNPAPAPSPIVASAGAASQSLPATFQGRLAGTLDLMRLTNGQSSAMAIQGQFDHGTAAGTLQALVQVGPGASTAPAVETQLVLMTAGGAVCRGAVDSLIGGTLVGHCSASDGRLVHVRIVLDGTVPGPVTGSVFGS